MPVRKFRHNAILSESFRLVYTLTNLYFFPPIFFWNRKVIHMYRILEQNDKRPNNVFLSCTKPFHTDEYIIYSIKKYVKYLSLSPVITGNILTCNNPQSPMAILS